MNYKKLSRIVDSEEKVVCIKSYSHPNGFPNFRKGVEYNLSVSSPDQLRVNGWNVGKSFFEEHFTKKEQDIVDSTSTFNKGDVVALVLTRYNPQLGTYVVISKEVIDKVNRSTVEVDGKKFSKQTGERVDKSTVNYGTNSYQIMTPEELSVHIKEDKFDGYRISGNNPFVESITDAVKHTTIDGEEAISFTGMGAPWPWAWLRNKPEVFNHFILMNGYAFRDGTVVLRLHLGDHVPKSAYVLDYLPYLEAIPEISVEKVNATTVIIKTTWDYLCSMWPLETPLDEWFE